MARKAPKIARQARLEVEQWREYFKHNINKYHMMHTFVLGEQWEDREEETLRSYKKIPMVCNKLGTMSNQLIGEFLQNTPQLQVVPLSNCDEETAKMRELLIKDIMLSEDSNTVYQVAAGQAWIGGYGAYLWDTEYDHRKSFDLKPVARYFKDSTRCYWDKGADDINKTDGDVGGYVTRMGRKKFRQIHGKKIEQDISKTMNPGQTQEEIALATQPSQGDDPFSWADDEGITIIHRYKRKYQKTMIYKMSNNDTYTQDEMDEIIKKSRKINNERALERDSLYGTTTDTMYAEEYLPINGQLLNIEKPKTENRKTENTESEENTVEVSEEIENPELMTLWVDGEIVRIIDKKIDKDNYKIIHQEIAGDYILEEAEFPSKHLPLIFVDQNSFYDKNGKQNCRSFFDDCKDTQRFINYLRTQSAYILKMTRYDQFMGSKKNVQGADTQRIWRDPGSFQGLLVYDESQAGNKPEQLRTPELSQSLLTQYQLAIEDLYTSTGLYPARMGNMGNSGGEASGKAMDAWQRQGSYSTALAYKSINRAIAAGGVVLNEMIPVIFDTQRVISLMTPDEGMKNITINEQSDDYGEHIKHDMRKGTYEVRLKPGPSYEGQKQITLESLLSIAQTDPEAFRLVLDLYADNLPLPNTLEIKNRLKTLVPPSVIEAGKTGKTQEMNNQPNPQQQMQQMEMEYKAKEMQLKEAELELRKKEIMLEAQAKLQELENDRLETAAKIKEQEMRYLAETERTSSDQMISHSDNLVKILTHNPRMSNER